MSIDDVYFNFWGKPQRKFTEMELALMEGGHSLEEPKYEFIKTLSVEENFKDGRHPEDKGDSARHGIPKHATISTLRKIAKQGGRKGQLAHWQANMRSGRNK